MGNTEDKLNKPIENEKGTDPEHLLKILELQLGQQRRERRGGDSRTAFRIWSLMAIVIGMIVALLVLQWMLTQLPRPQHPSQDESSMPSHVEQPVGR